MEEVRGGEENGWEEDRFLKLLFLKERNMSLEKAKSNQTKRKAQCRINARIIPYMVPSLRQICKVYFVFTENYNVYLSLSFRGQLYLKGINRA